MRITEINWTPGERYIDENGRAWKVEEQGRLISEEEGVYLGDITSLLAISRIEFKRVEECKEKEHYLRFNKPYVSPFMNYLTQIKKTDLLLLSVKHPDSRYKTRFTAEDVVKLTKIPGFNINDFTFVEANHQSIVCGHSNLKGGA